MKGMDTFIALVLCGFLGILFGIGAGLALGWTHSRIVGLGMMGFVTALGLSGLASARGDDG